MDRAIALAQKSVTSGNGPAGCVITREGRIISEGRNLVNTHRDPTAHAEITAIRIAAKRYRTISLEECTLYACIEPCPMCCWAMIKSRIPTLVLGSRLAHFRRKEFGTYSVEDLIGMTGYPLEIITGVREQECNELQYASLELITTAMRQVPKT